MKRRRWWIWAIVWCVLAGCGRSYSSGDRVLVSKFLYETKVAEPNRFDVIVFKYPREPVRGGIARNYIKRLLGLPGEILAIFFGQLFRIPAPPGDAPPYYVDDAPENELWEFPYMHKDDEKSRAWFQAGKFEPVRKSPEIMLAMRRPVYNNDFPARDLIGKVPPRWQPAEESGWTADQSHGFRHDGTSLPNQDFAWLRYRHLVVNRAKPQEFPLVVKPMLITDSMDYNSFTELVSPEARAEQDRTPPQNWVGDLMLECELKVLEEPGDFAIELNRGIYRYQARFLLKSGTCTLIRIGPDNKAQQLDTKPSGTKTNGTFQIRFANFDSRLTVWVDGNLIFGKGHDYTPPELPLPGEKDLSDEQFKVVLAQRCGPTKNDLEPVRIGSRGAAVEVRHLKLWRDTHYTLHAEGGGDAGDFRDWGDPDRFETLKRVNFTTMYVQPRHYLVLGDNSPASSDSRSWGTVPQRLLLGRALAVYYPFDRFGRIR